MTQETFTLQQTEAPAEKKRGYMAKSKRSDTNTPPLVLELVRGVMDEIDIDPCSNPGSITGARKEFWLQQYQEAYLALSEERKNRVFVGNGLRAVWGGRAYVNPPFDHLTRWVRKCAGEHEVRGSEIVLLSPARTDVRWFHEVVVPTATAVCLWKGRFTFLGEEYGCPFPPMFTYWGPHVRRFRETFGPHGLIFRP